MRLFIFSSFFLLVILMLPSAQAMGASEHFFTCAQVRQKETSTCGISVDGQKILNEDRVRVGTFVRCNTKNYVCLPEGCVLEYNFVSEKAARVIVHNCKPKDLACLCAQVCGTCSEGWKQR